MADSTTPADAIRALHHVRISVTDLARSRAFYEDIMGFQVAMESPGDPNDADVRNDPAQLFGGVAYAIGDNLFGLRPLGGGSDSFDPTRVGLDHVSFSVGSRDDLEAVAARLGERGVDHGDVIEMSDAGIAILSIQDPDDVNLELTAPL